MARIYRISQYNKCFYIFLRCKDTIDEIIFKVLKKKGREEDIVKEFLK
jgi:SNF2 family DNA or RNA helicase